MTEISTGEQRSAVITERAIENMRELIGVKIIDTVEPWCHEVTRDNVRHYAHGIGDDNPLWCDPDYAATTARGGIVAPPSFLFALNRFYAGHVVGLAGVHAMWSGVSTRWHSWLRRGEEVRTETYLKDLIEHDTRMAGRAIQQIYHVDFLVGDRLVAEGDSWSFRTERDTMREQKNHVEAPETEPRYTAADLEKIWEAYDSEVIRGAVPRYIEDVVVGEELPVMTKGPMTVTGFICYSQGCGGLYARANRLAYKQLRRHPRLGIADRFGIPDVPERVHWDDDFARKGGSARAYDYGPERTSSLTHHLTDWMGDDGFLVSHDAKIRRHNPRGDTITIAGKVTTVDIAASAVTIEQSATQQDGELSVLGTGVIRLPSRA